MVGYENLRTRLHLHTNLITRLFLTQSVSPASVVTEGLIE